jgi:hypothetical protein
MQLRGREARTEQLGHGAVVGPRLGPDLVGSVVAPVGEHADAVGARGDGVEVVVDVGPREVLEQVLPHLERRDDVERDGGQDAEDAETDDHPVEVVVTASGTAKLAVGRHEPDRRHCTGQAAVAVT